MTIHTFGDYCRWHPHVHGIVADGLFYSNGTFYVMPKNMDMDNLAALFRANALQMLKKEGRINDTLIKNIMGRRHMLELSDWIAKSEMLPFVKFIPVDNSVAVKSVNLPQPLHSDPADRIIIATAISLGVPLVTKDKKILKYPHVQTIW